MPRRLDGACHSRSRRDNGRRDTVPRGQWERLDVRRDWLSRLRLVLGHRRAILPCELRSVTREGSNKDAAPKAALLVHLTDQSSAATAARSPGLIAQNSSHATQYASMALPPSSSLPRFAPEYAPWGR